MEQSYIHTCRMQRCTDRYCPAEFWNVILVEGRPGTTPFSGEVSLSVARVFPSFSSVSDSDPEILDTSPANQTLENQPSVSTSQTLFCRFEAKDSTNVEDAHPLRSSSQTLRL